MFDFQKPKNQRVVQRQITLGWMGVSENGWLEMSTQAHIFNAERGFQSGVCTPAPGRCVVVLRPRIDRMLDRDYPVTLLVATADFGKTTALSCWRENATLPMAWIDTQSDDTDVPTVIDLITRSISKI